MKRSWLLSLVLSCSATAAPPPVLSGLYTVGELGVVDFSVTEGKVSGKLRQAHQCSNFSLNETVVTGSFEGQVFVGTIAICQDGKGCEAKRTYPFLGVYRDDAVSGFVHVDPGCSSLALDNRGIVIRPASAEERTRLPGATGSGASEVAQKAETADPVENLIREGLALLKERKNTQARAKLLRAIELDDSRWGAHLGVGVADIELGEPNQALPELNRALELSSRLGLSQETVSAIHFHRCEAYSRLGMKKEALSALRSALNAGGSSVLADARTDSHLKWLREQPEYQRLLEEFRKKPR